MRFAALRSHALLLLAAAVAAVFLVVPSFGVAAEGVMLRVSPESSTGSPIVLGLGGSQVVTVTNGDKAKGTSALTVGLVQSAVGAGFSISQNSCSGIALGPRKSCTVTVSYRTTPGPTGVETAVLTVSSKKPDASVTAHFRSTNRAPVAVNDSFLTNEDTPLTVAAPGVLSNDSDPDGDLTSVVRVNGLSGNVGSLLTLLSGALLTVHADGSIVYDPNGQFGHLAQGSSATDSFNYSISDGSLESTTASVNVTIIGLNDAPVANDVSASTFEDDSVTITLTASDSDGDPLTVADTDLTDPAHGTLGPVIPISPSVWQVDYTPEADFNGPDSFTYKVTDDGGLVSNAATVSITVAPVNDPPVAGADSFAASADTPLTIDAATLRANDVAGPPNESSQTLAVTSVVPGPDTHGTVSLSANTITYTPEAGFTGTAAFTYTVSDGEGGTAPGTVSITVSPVNHPPTDGSESLSVNEDDGFVLFPNYLLLNASDPDPGDTASVASCNAIIPESGWQVLHSGPSPGEACSETITRDGVPGSAVVRILPDGSVSWENPENVFNGLAQGELVTVIVQYVVTDQHGATVPSTLHISVNGLNDAPVAEDDVLPNVFGPVFITPLANDNDPDGDNMTVVLAGGPSLGTLEPDPDQPGRFIYTPSPGVTGVDSFTYRANDGLEDSNVATVTISITGTE
jgi:VCBS repeat-containing protein